VAARAVRGLSSADLDQVRRSLAAGRKPKVVFTESSGQLAGQPGQVVELTDPAASQEWIVVRFGHDTLSFAPTDLATPPKPARPARREPTAAIAVPTAAPPAQRPGNPPRQRQEHDPTPTDPAPHPATKALAPAPVPKAPARKAAKTTAPAALAVTIAYTDGAWTVAVQQGNRVLARPAQIRASQALTLIGQLALPEVQAAANDIVAADRAAAEHDADRLRAQLAEIEARLADLDT
jgi:hypothetical protein